MDLYQMRAGPNWPEYACRIATLSDEAKLHLRYEQPSQVLPLDKNVVLLAGRAFGKTARLGFTLRHIFKNKLFTHGEIAFIAKTPRDFERNILKTLVQQFPESERPDIGPGGDFNSQKGILTFPFYKRQVIVYSGADPDGIRGQNISFVIFDEYAHYQYPSDTFTNAILANRRGAEPRWIICTTTTDDPEMLDDLMRWRARAERGEIHLITGTPFDNPFLPPAFFRELRAEIPEDSYRWRTEVLAEILDEPPNALFTRAMLENVRTGYMHPRTFQRVIIAVDPAGSVSPTSDEIGIIVMGLVDDTAYVLADLSGRLNTDQIRNAFVNASQVYWASAIIIEQNIGEMWLDAFMKATESDLGLHIEYVRASRTSGGKFARIEPCAALVKTERLCLAGRFPDLELQMIYYQGGNSARSEKVQDHDDRVDALAYGAHHLLLKGTGPRIHTID